LRELPLIKYLFCLADERLLVEYGSPADFEIVISLIRNFAKQHTLLA